MENKSKTDEELMREWATSSEGGMKYVSMYDNKSGTRKTYLQNQLATRLDEARDLEAKAIVFAVVGVIFGLTWMLVNLV